ncbi:MAG: nuclear transport factor 2 family protein [Actinomycetota bacterium]|nr:nuclear transport factor 2 family protein [Actinomycetota bacterium]
MRSAAACLTALLCAALLAACGGGSESDEDQVRAVVQEFGEAANDKDAGAICGLVVSKELKDEEDCEKQADREGQIGGLEAVDDIEVSDIKIDGDRATAQIKATVGGKTDAGPGKFRKVDGEWKLDLDG